MKHDLVTEDISSDEAHPGDNLILAHMAGQGLDNSPGDIRQVLAANRKAQKNSSRKANGGNTVPSTVQVGEKTYHLNKGETISFQGHHYTAHMACIPYRVSLHDISIMEKALIDRGANGGICGDDMLVLEGSERFVDVFGLAGHKVNQLRIVSDPCQISTDKGDVIATFHQMALLGKGKSILSCLQMEADGADINDCTSTLHGGKQRILMDGYLIPLDFNNGLAYLRCSIPSMVDLMGSQHLRQ
jgi:hypothetical protein